MWLLNRGCTLFFLGRIWGANCALSYPIAARMGDRDDAGTGKFLSVVPGRAVTSVVCRAGFELIALYEFYEICV